VVNEYADFFWQLLLHLGWTGQRPKRDFQIHLSCDVDHPRLWWQPADRLRTLLGSLIERKSFSEAFFWFKNHLFSRQDPYDVFDEWMSWAESRDLQWHFNFLGARHPSSDCYYPLQHPFIVRLIEKMVARGHHIGFHPSYEAFENGMLFSNEIASLREVSSGPVVHGRQHYLRFLVPNTWRDWENADMAWDSSMGYSDAEGFRCGICYDFPVFDFVQRRTLMLREKPLIAMDVTLAFYQKYTPEMAMQRLEHLKQQVIKHQGEWVLLWHNSSWNTYFWAKWKRVFYSTTNI
jgi:hypothetical protein